jgi:transcriptional regulator GlxA family with amidase domain
MKTEIRSGSPRHFGFLLVKNFTLIALSSAVEPLRMANRLLGKNVYQWKTISANGEPVTASDGLSVNVDCAMTSADALKDVDAIIVCGGTRIEQFTRRSVLKWLNRVDHKGIAQGAICTGSYVLARAGLLDGYRCSIHWENLATLTDLFPMVQVSRSVFTIDRTRYTSSGGTAPVDMMLHFISEHVGADISAGVADQFIYERIRQSDDIQQVPLKHTIGKRSLKLVGAVELMASNIREPISQEDLATYVGLSRRQIQRLFQRYLSCTPSQYYMQLRLERARELLRQTYKSLVEISALTGFVYASHFSRSYKEFYGHSPSVERQNMGVSPDSKK